MGQARFEPEVFVTALYLILLERVARSVGFSLHFTVLYSLICVKRIE